MIHVRRADGVCRVCGGELRITDAINGMMTVECKCGECYVVEYDAFGDGGAEYWPAIMAELEGGE
jgi:hypothetical protein